MSEPVLIRRAQQGDAEAWETLVYQHQGPVFRLAYLRLGDPDAAEDVAQETFLKAYRALGRFDPQRPLRPWLLRIATNLSRNWWRSMGRYWAAVRRYALRDPLERQPVPDPEAETQDTQRAVQLWKAVHRLPPRDQEVIYLRIFLDLSVAETAQSLTVAEGTVKSRLHRALERLRRVIESEYPELQEGFEGE